MPKSHHRAALVVAFPLVAFVACSLLPAQEPPARPAEQTVLSLIPPESFFVVERRGHDAVRDAFLASNLGEVMKDEAILQFVRDSRVRIGRLIVANMFDLEAEQEVAAHQQTLHELLKPFWYNNCAVFAVLNEGFDKPPSVGFVCRTGKYKDQAKAALDALMKVGVPPAGQAGKRQAFTHTSGSLVWQAVASQWREWALSADPVERAEQLEDASVFMACWAGDTLLVALAPRAADALAKTVSAEGKPLAPAEASLAAKAGFQAVMKKTELKDWAFRWFVDIDAMWKAAKAETDRLPPAVVALGIDKVRGAGGTGGYADKVFTRLTYVDAPKADRGLLKLFKAGGSFKAGLAMAPREATFALAGQLDKAAVTRLLKDIMLGKEADWDVPDGAATAPATRPEPKLGEEEAKVLEQFAALADASGGNFAAAVLDLQSIMGMGAGGGPPICLMLDVTDQDKAAKAVETLIKLGDGDAPVGKEYRKAPIRSLGGDTQLAILKDRLILAMNDSAMTAAIDTALDKTGGFAPASKGEALVKLAGDGPGVFAMDLAALARLLWPMLSMVAQQDPEDFPLASLPSTQKMVDFLGPEIAVVQPDSAGLLLSSRGKIPFATKALFYVAAPVMRMMDAAMDMSPRAPAQAVPPAPASGDF